MPMPGGPLPFDSWVWDLGEFNCDPVVLARFSYTQTDINVVLEFQRNLTLVYDTLLWTGPRNQRVLVDRDGAPLLLREVPGDPIVSRAPYLFRFEDEDGTTIWSARPSYTSELIGLVGQRVRLTLSLADRTDAEIEILSRRVKRVTVLRLYRVLGLPVGESSGTR
jgi:hypothetical protein